MPCAVPRETWVGVATPAPVSAVGGLAEALERHHRVLVAVHQQHRRAGGDLGGERLGLEQPPGEADDPAQRLLAAQPDLQRHHRPLAEAEEDRPLRRRSSPPGRRARRRAAGRPPPRRRAPRPRASRRATGSETTGIPWGCPRSAPARSAPGTACSAGAAPAARPGRSGRCRRRRSRAGRRPRCRRRRRRPGARALSVSSSASPRDAGGQQ